MELRHLKYFVTVADEGSITKAAERLLMAQPPLSRQIQALEQELGAPLFLRGKGRQTILTEEGRIFYPYAKRILSLTFESIKAVRTSFALVNQETREGARQPLSGEVPECGKPGPDRSGALGAAIARGQSGGASDSAVAQVPGGGASGAAIARGQSGGASDSAVAQVPGGGAPEDDRDRAEELVLRAQSLRNALDLFLKEDDHE